MSARRVILAVERWFLADAPLEPLAACRIGLGLTCFGFYLLVAPSHALVWGADGILRHTLSPAAPDVRQVWSWLLLAGALVGSAGIALGLFTRVSGVVFIAAHLAHTTQTVQFTWGWSLVAPVLVGYLLVSGSHRMWSLDARRRGERVRVAPAWPLRLFQVNAVAIYLAAAWHRVDDIGWLRGEMVFEALTVTVFSRAPGISAYLMPWRGVLEVVCWITWLVELAAPILLWFRRTRPWIALALMAVHLGLEVSAFVGAWQLMMMSVLLTCLPARWLRAVAGWRPWRGAGSGRRPGADGIEAVSAMDGRGER